jgi:hypothetical protein
MSSTETRMVLQADCINSSVDSCFTTVRLLQELASLTATRRGPANADSVTFAREYVERT